VLYQIKDEVYEIIKQIFQFLRKDQQLDKDQQIFQTLFTNRELAITKIQRDEWQKPT
jgi:ArsR family transcriptional regulator